ncbi:hypothetical protein ET445_15575 [Agromyces protaetiae]|uniref:SAF domain-containing protein n=1 Tax=Agromyces protaetiae TaxID=2509455 RepID=A0A4P6FKM4_9MICO|nr:hypothetical protein [Agromyces protaetiae]QAY74537.1 hypothetical protein ET445_15575 [Agromyces protaetiae]
MAQTPDRGGRGERRIDPRLVLGILLIAASAVGVWALVAGLDADTEVYALRETATPGTRIDADDLALRSVRLGGAADRYLAPGDLPEGGLVLTRTVAGGELVPLSATAEEDASALARVVVPVAGALPGTVVAGATVDLWAAEVLERGEVAPPAVLVAGAEVAAIRTDDDFVTGGGLAVELLVPRERVAAVLQSLAAGDVVDLVEARIGSGS